MVRALRGDHGPRGTLAAIKQHTRNYAKRQGTWLRREPGWHAVDPQDDSRMLDLARAGA